MSVDEILRTAARTLEEEVRAEVDAQAVLDAVEEAGRRRGVAGPWLPIAAAVIVLIGLAALVVVAVSDDDRQPVTSGERDTTPTTTVIDGPEPGESLGLSVQATPNRDLRDGGAVEVTVEGLPTDVASAVELVMCTGDALDRAPGLEGCESADVIRPQTPTDGRVDTTFTVERFLNLDPDRIIDCAAPGVRCAIGVAVNEPIDPDRPMAGGPELVAVVGVSFAPVEPLGEPRLTVTPSEGLVHGETVTLEGTGFVGSVGGAQLCGPSSGGRLGPQCVTIPLGEGVDGEVRTDAAGRFTAEVRVWRMLAGMSASGEPLDCAVVVCTLELGSEGGTTAPPVRLTFDDEVPAPPTPTVEVSPTTGIRTGDPITITVRDLTPGIEVHLMACTLDGRVDADSCGQSTSLDPVVGEEDGVVTLTIPATDPLQYGQTCTEPGVCAVTLGYPLDRGDPLLWAVRPVPIQFAP